MTELTRTEVSEGAINGEDVRESLVRRGEVEKDPEMILASMRAHPDNGGLQESGIRALSALARDVPSSREVITSLNGIPYVFGVLSMYSSNKQVQTAGLAFLANMSLSKDSHRAILEKGGIDEVLSAMENLNPDSAQIQGLCLATLCNVTKDNSAAKTQVVQKGTLSKLLKVIKSHRQDPEVQLRGFSVLRNLSSLGNDVHQQIAQAEGISIINAGLATHRHNQGVVLQGICALLNLSCGNETLRTEIVHKCTAGILLSVKAHPGDHEIASNALSLFGNLASNDCNRDKLREHGGVVAVVQSMNTFATRPEVLENACNALCNLALSPQIRSEICKTDGPRLLNQTMCRFTDVADLQKAAISAHKNLVSAETQQYIGEEAPRTVDAIITAMKTHPGNQKLQTEACAALCNFAVDEATAGYMSTVSAAKFIITVLDKCPSSAELQASGCKALGNLVLGCPRNLSVIIDNRGMGIMLSAMANHSLSAGVQEGCFSVLSAVVNDHQIELPEQEQQTTLDLVLAAFRHHPSSEIVTMSGLFILAALIQNSNNNLEYVISQEAMKVVSDALARLPADSGMESVAEWLLETLTSDDQN